MEKLPLKIDTDTDSDYIEDFDETDVSYWGCGCGCFRGLFIGWRQQRNGMDHVLLQQGNLREGWLIARAKEIRHMSEVLAGPKWKNFIRRFGSNAVNKRKPVHFQYDLNSYALNFDVGVDDCEERFRFSDRYAAPADLNNG